MPETGRMPRSRSLSTIVLAVVVLLLAVTAAVLIGITLTGASDQAAPEVLDEVPATTMQFAVFIGDGSTQGVGVSSAEDRWVTLLSTQEQWEPSNLGKGGTGYTVSATPEQCGSTFCPSFRDMVPLAVVGSPDTVVVSGGRADLPAYARDPRAVREAIDATFAELLARLPDARLLAVGPSATSGTTPTLIALNDAIRSAVESNGGSFVDLLDPDFVATDPGYVQDGELTESGHAAMAERIESALGAG